MQRSRSSERRLPPRPPQTSVPKIKASLKRPLSGKKKKLRGSSRNSCDNNKEEKSRGQTSEKIDEELRSQKTIKKTALRSFFESTKSAGQKYMRELHSLRSKVKSSNAESRENITVDPNVSSEVEKEEAIGIKLNAEAIKTFEQRKQVETGSTEEFLFEDQGSRPREKPFVASQLFSKLHQENESDEIKKLRAEVERFYKSNPDARVPPTTISHYRLVKLIGKGSFGRVYLSVQLFTNRLVAVKCLEKNFLKDKGVKAKILQEIDILKTASQVPQVAKVLEVFENSKYVFLVMLYAKGGDLLRYLKLKSVFSEDEARIIFLKVLVGVIGLHSRKILHRDIKLDNILLDEHLEPTICDFGVSRKMADDETINEQCGTPAYIAPEVINEQGYGGVKADVWSLGVMLYAMVTGRMPFKGSVIEELHHSITTGSYKFPSDSKLSVEVRDLICRMMCVDVSERLSSKEVLAHKWMLLDSKQITDIIDRTCDYRVVPDEGLLMQVVSYGYTERAVRESLTNKKLNHATACYYNLERCLC